MPGKPGDMAAHSIDRPSHLCALEGAVRGIRWHDLEPEVKADLKAFYQTHKIV